MITLVVVADEGISAVWAEAEKTWTPYCRRHGYTLKVIRTLPVPSLHPSWNKVKAALDEVQCATGPVWIVDADMTVAKPSVPLESVVKSGNPAIFSSDWNGLCAGIFRVTPGAWTEWFLSVALFCRDVGKPDQFGQGRGCKWEQNTFKLLIREFPSVAENVGLLPKSLVCDKPPNQDAVIYHFGGRPNPVRIALMRQMSTL